MTRDNLLEKARTYHANWGADPSDERSAYEVMADFTLSLQSEVTDGEILKVLNDYEERTMDSCSHQDRMIALEIYQSDMRSLLTKQEEPK
jgi:hypothetical protein